MNIKSKNITNNANFMSLFFFAITIDTIMATIPAIRKEYLFEIANKIETIENKNIFLS